MVGVPLRDDDKIVGGSAFNGIAHALDEVAGDGPFPADLCPPCFPNKTSGDQRNCVEISNANVFVCGDTQGRRTPFRMPSPS